ncbi:MAG TPA: tol-pal system protein YbgF [Stellaceae bacterium]|nr:tol-pal system protein YbgF [Stellaceae bacterium]
MIWRPILSRFGPIMVLALIAVAAPSLSLSAQELSTGERLDRLERDLSMLQRQVYGRSVDAPDAGAEGGNAADIEIRMERLEQQMRDLTGHVEEVTNQIDQLRQRVEQINSDVEARLGEGVPAPPPPTAFGPGPMAPHRVPAPPGPLPEAEAPPPGAPPPPESGTLTPPMPLLPHPADSGDTGAGNPPRGGTLPSGSASVQYNFAFGLLKEADYPAAEEALRAFLQQHPDSALAGNAQFWLGETYYARGQYREAASAFAEGYRRYPRGPKAADDLLKLGMSLARGGERHNACLAFAQLDHDFPHSRGAVKERAAAEKKKLGCGS